LSLRRQKAEGRRQRVEGGKRELFSPIAHSPLCEIIDLWGIGSLSPQPATGITLWKRAFPGICIL